MTTKLAVPPIHPDAVFTTSVIVPQCWEDAFAMVSDRLARIVGRQAAEIKGLKDDLTDARGLIAANVKAMADLGAQVAGLAAAAEIQDTVTKAQGNRGAELFAAVDEIRGEVAGLVHQVAGTVEAVGIRADEATANADKLAGTVEAVNECVRVLGGSVDTLTGAVEAMSDRARAHGTRLDQVADKVETGRLVVEAVTKMVDDVGTCADAAAAHANELDKVVNDVSARADQVAELVEAYAQTASGEDAALSVRLDQVASILTAEGLRVDGAIARAVEAITRLDHLVIVVEANGTRTDTAIEAVEGLADEICAAIKQQGEHAIKLGVVEETVAGCSASAAALAREVRTIDEAVKVGVAAIGTVEDQSRDTLRRVIIALDQMPAGFMIDQAGVLNRVNRAGDVTPLGVVVGQAKDGISPAQIVAVKVENDRLVMTLSDRSEIGCAMPRQAEPVPAAAPVDTVDPLTLGHLSKDTKVRIVQVAHMAKMRGDKKGFKEIAALFAISERTAARLIKDHNDEKSSHG